MSRSDWWSAIHHGRLWKVILFLAFQAVCAAQGERWLIQMEIEASRFGPGSEVGGAISVDAGSLRIMPWLLDKSDKIDGQHFSIYTDDDQTTGKTKRLRAIYRASLPKGLLLEVDAARSAALALETPFGREAVPISGMSPGQTKQILDGRFRVRLLPSAVILTANESSDEYPSVAITPEGQKCIAHISWDGTRDSVMMRRGGDTLTLRGPGADALDPRCVLKADGEPAVIWSESDGKQWDLCAWNGGRVFRLTRDGGNDFWPRVARDSAGRIWLAWQSVAEDRHYEIRLAQWDGEHLSDAVNVSESEADDWEPSICATADGRLVVAWDTFRNGSFDIYARDFRIEAAGPRPMGPPIPVAASAAREAHATVVSDQGGRVWIAWDVAGRDWGKHPGGGGSLHSERSIDVACWSGGVFRRPASELAEVLTGEFRKHCEYPQIALDGHERLWVIFRYQNRVQPLLVGGRGRAQSYGMWHEFAMPLNRDGWGAPLLLAHSNGRQDMRAATAIGRNGELVVCYGTDGRTRDFPYRPVDYDIAVASLEGFGSDGSPYPLVEAPDLGKIAPIEADPELSPLPRSWAIGGNEYRLVLGDTHRHTDISRCANGRDGSLQDAYRYALDACGLDWLAISDHDQDILRHRQDRQERPRQLYDWWRSQKYCDLYSIPGRFVALYGYEHGGGYKDRGGHKNVVYADRGQPVFEQDAPEELFAALKNSGALAIPHQLADGGSRTDWEKWNREFERVAEIFQARGSYEFQGCPREAEIGTEGNMMWDALAKGIRIGIIASSDHGQTHEARAGVYVPVRDGFSRTGILGALRDRRAFGSTVAVALRMEISGRPIGEELELAEAPALRAQVDAASTIRRVEVVRDGAFVYSVEPGTAHADLTYSDVDLKPGASAYYYVRALIGERDIAWSSPVWVTRKAR